MVSFKLKIKLFFFTLSVYNILTNENMFSSKIGKNYECVCFGNNIF